MKAYNKITGLWFVWGRGFMAPSQKQGTSLSPSEAAIVAASYENAVFVCEI